MTPIFTGPICKVRALEIGVYVDTFKYNSYLLVTSFFSFKYLLKKLQNGFKLVFASNRNRF